MRFFATTRRLDEGAERVDSLERDRLLLETYPLLEDRVDVRTVEYEPGDISDERLQ